ncbi:MAG: ATP synthase F1 subunit gamma [Candidatus Gastranaerophilales bacterium]|nr:ATP synthase F1 subunit gamma [Candidatus Gastranaerophilales bacterium]
MANLKNIRDRISSINNTQKITRAMKMVAAAKVKKSENRVKASRPFTKELGEMLYKLLGSLNYLMDKDYAGENALDNYPALLEKREQKNVGLLVVTSNKGLAGAFNANVVRHTLKKIKEYNEQGKKCKLFVVGLKGLGPLKHAPKDLDFEILTSYTKFTDPTSAAATVIAEDIAKSFIDKEIDSIDIVTTRFRNMMSYSVEDWHILPLVEKTKEAGYIDLEMDFEPGLSQIMQKTLPLFVANTIFQALLESTASELASRMTAMSAACNNAEEMIRTLTVDYNKARQTAITQEITEVVSGADSLK